MAQRARAARRLFLRSQPAPSLPGAAGSLAPSCPRGNVPVWAWVRLLTRPARPAPPTRRDPEAEGAVPAVAGAWPRPVAGLRGVGRGWGLLRWEPAPLSFLRSSAARPWCPRPFGSPHPSPPPPGHPAPGVPAAPFHQGPLTLCRLAFSFKSHSLSGLGQPFRSLVQRDSGGIWTCQEAIFALRTF